MSTSRPSSNASSGRHPRTRPETRPRSQARPRPDSRPRPDRRPRPEGQAHQTRQPPRKSRPMQALTRAEYERRIATLARDGRGRRPVYTARGRRPQNKVAPGALLSAVVVLCLVALLGLGVKTLVGKVGATSGTGSDVQTVGAVQGSAAPDAAQAERAEPTQVSFAMVGDVLVHRPVWESGEMSDGTRNYDHLFSHVADDLSSVDVGICNQETILGGTAMGLSGYPSFNSPQEIGDAEVDAGVDLVTQATNHALDKGLEGIKADLAFWREDHPQVKALGISDDASDANSVWLYEKDGMRVAFINMTFSTNGYPIPDEMPTAVRMLSDEQIARDVEQARAQGADCIVALPHWGIEYETSPSEEQRAYAKYMCELGVDVIVGAHPHVIQPVEEITSDDGHKTVVFWSLGNFISNSPSAQTMVGGMAKVTLTKDQDSAGVASYEFVPLVTQRNAGTERTTYKLADYTEDLAAQNGIRHGDTSVNFTRTWVEEFVADVLGPDFDQQTSTLHKDLASAA